MIDSVECIGVALSISIDEAPLTTRSYVHYVDFGCKVSWSPPFREQLWVHTYFEYYISRCVEFAGDEYFLLAWFRGNGCLNVFCHILLPSFKLINFSRWPIIYAYHSGPVRLRTYQLQVHPVREYTLPITNGNWMN